MSAFSKRIVIQLWSQGPLNCVGSLSYFDKEKSETTAQKRHGVRFPTPTMVANF